MSDDTPTILRAEFDKLSAARKRAFLRDGLVVDPAPPPPAKRDLAVWVRTRAQFDALTPAEKRLHIRGGGTVID